MPHEDEDEKWLHVCDDCGKEWPYSQKAQAEEHERRLNHSTYQQDKSTHEAEKGKRKPKGSKGD